MKRHVYGVMAILMLFYAGIVGAGEDEEVKEGDNFRNEANAYVQYAPQTLYTGCEYSNEYKIFDKLPVTFSIGNDAMFIYKSTDVSLPSHLVAMTTDVETVLPLFGLKGFYVGVGVSPSFYSNGWNFEGEAFRIPSRGFLVYQPDDKLTLVGGVAVFPKLKYPVWPIFGIVYKPVKELEFNLLSENPNIIYRLNDRVSLFAEGDFDYDEYEVDADTAKSVILRYEDFCAGGGVEFKFSKFTKAAITAGGIFDRSLKYRSTGEKVDLKGGFYTEAKMAVEF
jgi:hypothetical protein